MFATDKFVFLELYKTGCSHVRQLLKVLLPDQVQGIGKHNRLPPELEQSGRMVVGSIRDPWDWYVSLWAFGCEGRGALDRRLKERSLRGHHHAVVPGQLGWTGKLRVAQAELFKPVGKWRAVYADSSDPALFRQWLAMVLDPKWKYSLGDGYAFSPVSDFSGLYTHYYLNLFTRDLKELYFGNLPDYTALFEFVERQLVVDRMLRNESLDSDVFVLLGDLGYALPEAALTAAQNLGKTNVSSRSRHLADYYDAASVDLVRAKEKLIIETYGYAAPQVH